MLETPSSASLASAAVGSALDARSTEFGDFVAGPENRAALVAVARLLQLEAGASPLVLCGPSGFGKSHLCRAVAQAWTAAHPGDVVVSLTAAEFAEQYAATVKTDRVAPLRARLRGCDLLILDEVTKLGPKVAAQWELLYALDALYDRGASVLCTSFDLPSKFDELLPALCGRLLEGAVVGLATPSADTRRRLLARLVERHATPIDAEALDLLAADLETSVPALAGALCTLQAAAADERRPLDANYVRRWIQRRAGDSAVTLKAIAQETARRFGLTVADLKSHSRRRTLVAARDTAVGLARRLTNLSLQEIGDYFGGRDHTTVLHGYRKWEATLERDAETRTIADEIRRQLRHM